MDDCCGTGIYWCPTAGEFQCPTHGGHDTCCDHPERHTPLSRFGVQAEALLKWARERRSVVVPGTAENSKRALRAHRAGVPVSLDHDSGEWAIQPRTAEEWAEWGRWEQ